MQQLVASITPLERVYTDKQSTFLSVATCSLLLLRFKHSDDMPSIRSAGIGRVCYKTVDAMQYNTRHLNITRTVLNYTISIVT